MHLYIGEVLRQIRPVMVLVVDSFEFCSIYFSPHIGRVVQIDTKTKVQTTNYEIASGPSYELNFRQLTDQVTK